MLILWLVVRQGKLDKYVHCHCGSVSGTFEKRTSRNFPVMLEPHKVDPLAYRWCINGNMLCSTTVPEESQLVSNYINQSSNMAAPARNM